MRSRKRWPARKLSTCGRCALLGLCLPVEESGPGKPGPAAARLEKVDQVLTGEGLVTLEPSILPDPTGERNGRGEGGRGEAHEEGRRRRAGDDVEWKRSKGEEDKRK